MRLLAAIPLLLIATAAVAETRRKYANSYPDFQKRIHGLRVAAERIHREEFEKIVNPAPVQMQLSFVREVR